MSESNGEPNIELKNLDMKIDGVSVRVENGKVYISGGSSDVSNELKRMERRLKADQALGFGGTIGASITLTGVTLAVTHLVDWWVYALYVVGGLCLMWEALRFRNNLLRRLE